MTTMSAISHYRGGTIDVVALDRDSDDLGSAYVPESNAAMSILKIQ